MTKEINLNKIQDLFYTIFITKYYINISIHLFYIGIGNDGK